MLRERGWLAVVVIVASMVGGAVSNLLLTARLDAQGADVVTASQINIVDRGGRLRAVLTADDELGMTSLTFYGPDGTMRGVVGTEPDGTPVLQFTNPAGVSRLSASVRGDEPVIAVGDEQALSVLIGSVGGTPIVGLSERGRMRLQMDLGSEGEPHLSLFNSARRRGLGLVVNGDNAPVVSLYDAAGAQRLTMGIVQGSTVVNLGDGTRSRLVLGVADNGRASVAFYNAGGELERDLSPDAQQ